MNILLLGSGGREHSLVKSLYESSKNKKIFALQVIQELRNSQN